MRANGGCSSSYADFPQLLVRAYLCGGGQDLFQHHGGIDYPGIASAHFRQYALSDQRARGRSTITQQVAKNLLLTNEYSYTRKVKEAILAKRIEGALTKPQILSLYLNEIALGRQSLASRQQAQAYFGKSVDQLAAARNGFPRDPAQGARTLWPGQKRHKLARWERRNWVLGEMRANGWITDAQLAEARCATAGPDRAARQRAI